MVKAFGYNSNGGADVQEFLDLDMPSPMPGELLVEVRTAGVNPVDWKIRSGLFGGSDASSFPAVLGSEVSGVVREVGKDVEGFAVNDEVFGSVAPGSGGYTEYTLVTASAAAHKPLQVSFHDAATLPVAAATAYDGVTQLNLDSWADAADQRHRRWRRRSSRADRQGLRHQRHRHGERGQANTRRDARRHPGRLRR